MDLKVVILAVAFAVILVSVNGQQPRSWGHNHGARLPSQQRGTTRRPRPTTTRPSQSLNGVAKLRTHPIDRSKITISGFSSGGTLAQQLLFSHADLFAGVAVFSHAYYRCGPGDGDLNNYDSACTKLLPGPDKTMWDPQNALNDIRSYARQNLISDPRTLRSKRLYVYAGLQNVFFTLDTSLAILRVFDPFITNPHQIRTRIQDANLVLPVNRLFGAGNCSDDPFKSNLKTFIGNCGLNGPLEALDFLLEGKHEIREADSSVRLNRLEEFDQREFFTSNSGGDFMDDVGYLYVPTGCQGASNPSFGSNGQGSNSRPGSCLLHVYLHGCLTGRRFVGEDHIRQSGFLELAEKNKIIMLFPQNVNLTGSVIGCWDTYGGTGPLYATRQGNQVRVIRSMISRLLGERSQTGVGGINFLEKRHAVLDQPRVFADPGAFDPRK